MSAPKPATPLPWEWQEKVDCGYNRHSRAIGPIILDPSEGEYAPGCRTPDDADYAGHAANAYPRLVGALWECRNASDDTFIHAMIDEVLGDLGEL